jgi:hypothetical protein
VPPGLKVMHINFIRNWLVFASLFVLFEFTISRVGKDILNVNIWICRL